MLLDSNVIIDAASEEGSSSIRAIRKAKALHTTAINYIEVLGYPHLSEGQRAEFIAFFEKVDIIGVTKGIRDRAILLKRKEKLKTADAIIAATALVQDIPLVTLDSDFKHVEDLTVIHPREI